MDLAAEGGSDERSYDPSAENAKLERLIDATIDGAALIMDLFQALMIEIVNGSIPGDIDRVDVGIGEPIKLSEQHVPFFVQP